MPEYRAMIYNEYQTGRHKKRVEYELDTIVKAQFPDALLKKLIVRAAPCHYGTIIEIKNRTSNTVLRKVEKTERIVPPYSSQWTEYGKASYNPGTKNYIYRNKTLYVVHGIALYPRTVC